MNAAFPNQFKSKFLLGCIASFLTVASTGVVVSALPTIKAIKGANQQTVYGSAFPASLIVWVSDSVNGHAVPGLRIDFTPGTGIGLSSSYAITDERGLASVTATGLVVCTSSVSAAIAGVAGAKVGFTGLVVDKAPLTIVPADISSKPGASVPSITSYTITGFVNGETEESAQITGSPILTIAAKEHRPHTNYAIKGGVGSLSSPNYTFVAGFGTLAILAGANMPDLPLEASIVAPEKLNVIEVHRAILNQSEDISMTQEDFAGARNTSATPVSAAVSLISEPTPATAQPSQARSAMAVVVATDSRKASGAPVRAVVLPKLTTNSKVAKISDTRSAMLVVVADMQKNPDVPVRSAISPALSTAVLVQVSAAQPVIRKAFVLPGTEQ
jgi:hypothetical protein